MLPISEQPARPEIGIVSVETSRIVSVIDDDAAVRRATSSLLRSLGFSVRIFVSAEDFLKTDSADVSACIVSDINMDGMSGIELYALLQQQANVTPFIFITALAETVVRKQVGSEICVLQKPFQAESLVSCIDRAMPPAN